MLLDAIPRKYFHVQNAPLVVCKEVLGMDYSVYGAVVQSKNSSKEVYCQEGLPSCSAPALWHPLLVRIASGGGGTAWYALLLKDVFFR